jgi:hypothetical protein
MLPVRALDSQSGIVLSGSTSFEGERTMSDYLKAPVGGFAAVFCAIFMMGCSSPHASFSCQNNTDCNLMSGGRCESTGYCAYPTTSCCSGYRYDKNAGSLASTCVPGGICSEAGPPDGALVDGARLDASMNAEAMLPDMGPPDAMPPDAPPPLPPPVCTATGFCFQTPPDFTSVYADSPTDAWAGGDYADAGVLGALWHWNGISWSDVLLGMSPPVVLDVWASGPTNVWLTGTTGAGAGLYHWDGTSLTPASLGLPNSSTYSVWGIASNNVWAVGQYPAQYGFVTNYDGTNWNNNASTFPVLVAIRGSDTNNIWAMTNAAGAQFAEPWSFNGSSWSAAPTFTANVSVRPAQVWTDGPSDVWVAAWAYPGGPTVERYDGTKWSSVAVPSGNNLQGLWGASSTAVWAGATDGTNAPELLSSTGGAFTATASPAWINAIGGTSATDVWAVGPGGSILHGGTGGFTPTIEQFGAVSGLWGSSGTDIYAVGTSLGSYGGAGQVHHFDGRVWTSLAIGIAGAWQSVFGSGPSDVWVAGTGTTLAHFDGTTWKGVTGPSALTAGWSSGAGNAWGIAAGAVYHWNGTSWGSALPISTSGAAIWGSGSGDVYASGSTTALLHYDGTNWGTVTLPGGAPTAVTAIGGTSATDVWAAGGMAYAHLTGTTWQTGALATAAGSSLWALSPTDAWIGDASDVQKWNGTAWTSVDTGINGNFQTALLYGTSTDLWIAGAGYYSGYILHSNAP